MHPPVHLCFSTLKLRPTSNARIMLRHTRCSRGDTLLHMRNVSHIHTKHILTIHPQLLPDFHVSRFISFPHFGCSVSSERLSRCWQSVTPMFTGTSSVLFLLCLVSLCFSCHVIFLFWATICSKRQPSEKELTMGVRLNHVKTTRGRGHSQAV